MKTMRRREGVRMTPAAGALRLTVAAALVAAGQAQAARIDTGNPDLEIRWDNTVKYSIGARLKDRLPELSTLPPAVPNQNDGNNNFDKGALVQNRLDLFSEFDAKYRQFGVRLSAAAWYDDVYRRSNDNTTTSSNRPVGQPANAFSPETRKVMGKDGELLDAFVFGQFAIDERPITVRLGRHTMLFGESLFFGANSVAAGQAPTDLVKALSVPGSTTKEIARPTGKLSVQATLSDSLAVTAYVPYEWEKSRLMPVGAYLAAGDAVGPGAERNFAGANGSFTSIPSLDPKASGQGGISLRWRVDAIDTDLGFHAVRYHAHTPSNLYVRWAGLVGQSPAQTVQVVHHEGTRAFAISAAKTIDAVSLGAEISVRENTPLASNGASIFTNAAGVVVNGNLNNSSNPGYAVGRTAHAQINWIATLPRSGLFAEASLLGEIAWNRRLSFTSGEQFAAPLATRDATAVRLVFSPAYRQVLDGMDLTVPIGVGYTVGRSSALGPAFGPHKGGDFSVGLAATYLTRWNVSARYVQYLGEAGAGLNAQVTAQYKQALKDRNFVTLSVQTTF